MYQLQYEFAHSKRFPRQRWISLSKGFNLFCVSDQKERRDATNPAKGGSDGGAPVRGYGLSQDLPAVWEYLAERCVRPCHIKCECFPLSNLITDFYGGISRRAERQSKKDGNWTFFSIQSNIWNGWYNYRVG